MALPISPDIHRRCIAAFCSLLDGQTVSVENRDLDPNDVRLWQIIDQIQYLFELYSEAQYEVHANLLDGFDSEHDEEWNWDHHVPYARIYVKDMYWYLD